MAHKLQLRRAVPYWLIDLNNPTQGRIVSPEEYQTSLSQATPAQQERIRLAREEQGEEDNYEERVVQPLGDRYEGVYDNLGPDLLKSIAYRNPQILSGLIPIPSNDSTRFLEQIAQNQLVIYKPQQNQIVQSSEGKVVGVNLGGKTAYMIVSK